MNGNTVSKEEFNRLKPNDIKKIKVLKRGTAEAMKTCADGNSHDIYLVTTK